LFPVYEVAMLALGNVEFLHHYAPEERKTGAPFANQGCLEEAAWMMPTP